MAVITDKKIAHSPDSTTIDYYNADITTATDYYPFGMQMPGRNGHAVSSGGSNPGGSSTAPTTNLIVNSRTGNLPALYEASNSIVFDIGFGTGVNDVMEARIASASSGGTGGAGTWVSGADGVYRYGFNGKENDNEVKGDGNQQDYGIRIYDTRLGRFLSVDPLTKKYPMLTPYQFASNSPITGVDLDGLEFYYAADGTLIAKSGTNNTQVRVIQAEHLAAIKSLLDGDKIGTPTLNKLSTDIGMTNEELNTRAMLFTIRNTEAWGNKTLDYDDQYGGGKFGIGKTDAEKYKSHPRTPVTKWKKTSTASGAYMMKSDTYDWVSGKTGTTDFFPESQDKMTVWMFGWKKALDDIKSGKLDEAFAKLKQIWTSLPGAKEQGLNAEKAKEAFKTGVSNELNNKSDIATPKGKTLPKP